MSRCCSAVVYFDVEVGALFCVLLCLHLDLSVIV